MSVFLQQYDFTTWGGVLFCAALAIFFLSIFTPLWLALSTTVSVTLTNILLRGGGVPPITDYMGRFHPKGVPFKAEGI